MIQIYSEVLSQFYIICLMMYLIYLSFFLFAFVLFLFGDAALLSTVFVVVVFASPYASSLRWQVSQLALSAAHSDRWMMLLYFQLLKNCWLVCL